MEASYQMLSLLLGLLAVLRMVTRASVVPTLRASSLLCFNSDCPAKAVEAHAVAAAMVTDARNELKWRMELDCGKQRLKMHL